MITRIDPTDAETATQIVRVQRAAYAVEAELIGFDGIPTMHETVTDVRALARLRWFGVVEDKRLVALIAWEETIDEIDIDRLAVDPSSARKGHGRRLVQHVPDDRATIVSTGTLNAPAKNLYLSEGYVETGQTEIAPGVFTTQFRRSGR